MTEHSELGASGCKLWWNCPGSVNFCRDLPNEDNEHSIAGTAAHAVAEMCLRNEQEAEEYIGRMVDAKGTQVEVTAKMAEDVQQFVEACRNYIPGASQYWIERSFDLSMLGPPAPMFGTADFVAIVGRRLIVVDYKNGFVPVEGEGNMQLRYYALGAWLSLPKGTPIDRIDIMIVQPNAQGKTFKSELIEPEDLLAWSIELIEHAEATIPPDAPRTPGSWCKDNYCRGRGRCPDQADSALAVAATELPAMPSLLEPEQVAYLLSRIPEVKAFIKSVEEAGTQLAHQETLPGWTLAPKRGTQSWADAKTAGDMLTGLHELDESEAYEPREVVSPARARKALGAKIYAEAKAKGQKYAKKSCELDAARLLDKLIVTTSSGFNLVPVSEDNPALPPGGSEFSAITEESET
jgi:hypothetical protein